MKKILLIVISILYSVNFFSNVFAGEFGTSPALGGTVNVNGGGSAASSSNSQNGGNGIVPINTTNVTTSAIQNSQNIPNATSNTTTASVNNDTSTNNILGIPNNELRTGTVDMDTIPRVLVSIINVLLGVAGTISIVALIYYAIQMQINSGITGDSSGVDNAKKGMKGAILGFIVAILAWFIVIRFIEILSRVS